jgi:hypothetical protein
MKLHFTHHIEESGNCPDCGAEPLLVEPASLLWRPAITNEHAPDEYEPSIEVTGHYCTECEQMVSISVNGWNP